MKPWFVLLTAACGIYTPSPLAPTVEPYSDKFLDSDFGKIPADLHGAVVGFEEAGSGKVAANASNDTSGGKLPQLIYAGLSDKGMCFVYHDAMAQTNEDPADGIVKQFQDEVLNDPQGGMWIQPVASLKTLAPEQRWPPPAGSVRIKSVELHSDDKLTTTERKKVGGGDYVEVKHDYRIVMILFCADKPAVTPASKYLVLDRHLGPRPSDLQPETTESGDHEAHNEAWRRQHDAFFIWEIGDAPAE
jgi:hypothetical protein